MDWPQLEDDIAELARVTAIGSQPSDVKSVVAQSSWADWIFKMVNVTPQLKSNITKCINAWLIHTWRLDNRESKQREHLAWLISTTVFGLAQPGKASTAPHAR